MAKSGPVQSSKVLKQIALTTVADLLNAACGSKLSAAKRFASSISGDLCNNKDAIIINEFLPLLVKELESSTAAYDRMVALTALGSLGVEEIIPILVPVIRGNGKFDDSAERIRAILSLQRVVFTAPEKVRCHYDQNQVRIKTLSRHESYANLKQVHPILASLATNFGERSEVRMAAIGVLLTSNAPLPLFQKIAVSTWFEPSKHVISFVNSLVSSLARAPAATPLIAEL